MPQIKFLNKFVLANILKNFRWLKFDFNRNLNNLYNCPRCYSLSLRYSIYKVQTRSFRSFLSAANFYILAHLVELVKNFFQVFSNSFLCSLRSRLSPFITQLLYVIIFTSFCQEAFSCFLKFSDLFLSFAERLAYISIPYSLCQALFYKFFYSFLVYLTKKHLSLYAGLLVFFSPFSPPQHSISTLYNMQPPELRFRGFYYI